MRSPPGRRDRKLRALSMQTLSQSRDQIRGQKGAVSRNAQNPLRVGSLGCGPIERGEDSSERARIVPYPVSKDRQAKRCKALRIAIGVQKQTFALRLEPLDNAGENRAPADFPQWLVAAAYSPREPPCKNDARRAEALGRHGRRPFARGERSVARRFTARLSGERPKASAPAQAGIDAPRAIRACRAMAVTRLDLSGLKCPLPALKTRKALNSLAPGDRLEVRCTDPLAAIDIPHLVGVTGDRLEAIERGERDIVFHIEKSTLTLRPKASPC